MLITQIETQGWRPNMEDSILNQKVTNHHGEIDDILGIFDGHGGSLISIFCKIVFPFVLEENFQIYKSRSNRDDSRIIRKSLKRSVEDMD